MPLYSQSDQVPLEARHTLDFLRSAEPALSLSL